MGIVDEDIARVRDASDIVAVIGEHVALKRVGRRWQGLCPFHQEKSPSFSVNGEQGLYYCFGCGAKGDAITFVREIEHVDFVGAVEKLAAKAGVQLRYTDQGQSESRKAKAKLVDAVAAAVAWYHERLRKAPDAAKARGYLRSRGFGADEVATYQLGWAPEGWDELVKGLRLPRDVMVDAGLARVNSRGSLNDFFRGRLLFPIYDATGDPVAFGGRILPGATGPKYLNSAENRIYAKSRTLYGLNWHKAAIVTADEAIVCEGYTDVIGFAQAGLARSVATCGTALTEDHFRVLKSYAHRVVLAFDADAAGQNAAARFYEWERQYEIDVAVADLPTGVDPAELAQQDPSALSAAIAGARPFLKFRLDRVLAAANLSSAEGRARGAEAAMAVIAEHPNPLVRDQYVMEVADRTRIDPERLRSDAGRGTGRGAARGPGGPGPGRAVVADRRRGEPPAEVEALRLLVQQPEELAGALDDVLFADDRTLGAYRALRDHASFHDALASVDEATAALLSRLVVEESEADPADVLVQLIRAAALREVKAAEGRLRAEPERMEELSTAEWLMLRVNELDDPHGTTEAAEQLLRWLTVGESEGV